MKNPFIYSTPTFRDSDLIVLDLALVFFFLKQLELWTTCLHCYRSAIMIHLVSFNFKNLPIFFVLFRLLFSEHSLFNSLDSLSLEELEDEASFVTYRKM